MNDKGIVQPFSRQVRQVPNQLFSTMVEEAMAMVNRQVLGALNRLLRIIEAGERGYATAATNANRRSLKLLFKSFAQQRAKFKTELLQEIKRLGGDYDQRLSILGIIHRGRVAIFAAMTIEDDKRERVVLKEAALGERFAIQTYQRTLALDLPPETRQIVTRQHEEVQKVIEQINLLLGKGGKSLVVGLFPSKQDSNDAVQTLKQAGFSLDTTELVDIDTSIDQYHGKGTTVLETMISGSVGGMVWGSLIGVLAGIGAVQTSIPEMIGTTSFLGTLILVALITIILAAIVGGLIGLVIGAGIAEDDSYVYQQSIHPGGCMVKTVVDTSRAQDARRILDLAINQAGETRVGQPA